MNWRPAAFACATAIFVLVALFYAGVFMHGD
jgi:hypothetical protein